jgi:hypothetical protein
VPYPYIISGSIDLAKKQAMERGGRKDFTFLSNMTGWDPAAIAVSRWCHHSLR